MSAVDPHAASRGERLNDPTRRAEAMRTPEDRGRWDEPRHPEASEAKAPTATQGRTAAISEGVRAEARSCEQESGAIRALPRPHLREEYIERHQDRLA